MWWRPNSRRDPCVSSIAAELCCVLRLCVTSSLFLWQPLWRVHCDEWRLHQVHHVMTAPCDEFTDSHSFLELSTTGTCYRQTHQTMQEITNFISGIKILMVPSGRIAVPYSCAVRYSSSVFVFDHLCLHLRHVTQLFSARGAILLILLMTVRDHS